MQHLSLVFPREIQVTFTYLSTFKISVHPNLEVFFILGLTISHMRMDFTYMFVGKLDLF